MKIIRLVTSLDFGGVEKRIEITSEEFIKNPKVVLFVVALGAGGATSAKLEQLGIKTILLKSSYKIPSLVTIIKLYKLFKKLSPDIVHTSGAEANFHGLIAAWLAGVKVRIGEEIGFPRHNTIKRLIFNITYRFANKVIGISKSVVNKIIELKEVKLEKAYVVYNPVHIANVHLPLTVKDEGVFTFICVSRLVPIKNIKSLIEAFSHVASLSKRPVKLHVVGDGPELKNLEEIVVNYNLSDKVFFLGFRDDVESCLAEADAYVLTSFSEGFSIALVEAMLAHCISIATQVGGPSEIINPGKTGFLIDPYVIGDIRDKMMMAINLGEDEKTLMIDAAKKDVINRFSPDRYVSNLLDLYRICQK